ncbi:MAG: hypothetical protein QF363_14305, partial [Planctomycetaceae bacterium]|nr:hypothetical protein [Planctomycetaceae bacterium]
MAAATRSKAPSRQKILSQLTTALSKRYGSLAVDPVERPIFQTLVYAICLENSTFAEAESSYERLSLEFHDYNEARVSSISELERVFRKTPMPEWKALRLRNLLTHVFESFYVYDFDYLRTKSSEQASRLLGRVPHLSHFARNFVLQRCLEVHLIPFDQKMRDAVAWLGLGTRGQTPQRAGAALRTVIRKADTDSFCGLIRCFATDAKVVHELDPEQTEPPKGGYELESVFERLNELFSRADTRKSAPKKKPAPKK